MIRHLLFDTTCTLGKWYSLVQVHYFAINCLKLPQLFNNYTICCVTCCYFGYVILLCDLQYVYVTLCFVNMLLLWLCDASMWPAVCLCDTLFCQYAATLAMWYFYVTCSISTCMWYFILTPCCYFGYVCLDMAAHLHTPWVFNYGSASTYTVSV